MRQGDAVHRNPDIEVVVRRLLSPRLTVAVGTDDEEWWDDYGALITTYLTQFAAMGPCTVQASSPHGYSHGDIGWFEDRALVTLHDGESVPVRFTGVVSDTNSSRAMSGPSRSVASSRRTSSSRPLSPDPPIGVGV